MVQTRRVRLETRRRNLVDLLRPARKLISRIESAQVRGFGGSMISLLFRTPVLVLTTTGRRSGKVRDTPLAYLRLESGDLLVVGGAAGQTRLPDWVANVRANPAVTVTVDRAPVDMHAVELEGRERQAAWERAVDRWPRIAAYEAKAGRPVPVVRLSGRTHGHAPPEVI